MASGVPRDVALKDRDEHEFFVPDSAGWETITVASMNLGETLNIASHAVEEANTPRLDGVLAHTNWNDELKLGSPANREGIIRSLLNHFGDLDLRDENLREDKAGGGNVLGDACEYLINRFADDAGKKGRRVLHAETRRPPYRRAALAQRGHAYLRPHLRLGRDAHLRCPIRARARRRHQQSRAARPGAQPRNALHRQTQSVAPRPAGRAAGARGRYSRTWSWSTHRGRLLSYDRVHRQSAYSASRPGVTTSRPMILHHRFDRYGAIPPRTRGDLAFLLHMLSVTNSRGMVGVVMPHGILFRSGSEGKIRRGIVEADLFEAVIGLAPNLFSGASIPVAICVLNKAKPAERRGRVLFVDAAQKGYYRQEKARNHIDRDHIGKIVEAYQAFEDMERFAHVADLEEIEANDFNLNISRYVDTTEPVEVMSVEDALAQLRDAERRRDEAVAKMDELLAELGFARRFEV